MASTHIFFSLQEARAGFRQLLCESTVRIDSLAKKLGACVDRARPYYEARMKAKEVTNFMAYGTIFTIICIL